MELTLSRITLIETASHSTGSLLIWDTGEHSILPYREPIESQESSSEGSDGLERPKLSPTLSESQKLHKAFQQSKIRLRLHGARVPQNYTISLRLSKENYCNEQPGWPKRRRRKLDPKLIQAETIETSSSEGEYNASSSSSAPFEMLKRVQLESCRRTASPPLKYPQKTASNPSIRDEP
jgi:DNA polymerase Ligase (LigD)